MYVCSTVLYRALKLSLLSAGLVACKSDCLALPCPSPVAATINVSAPSAPGGIQGLTMTVNGVAATNLCQQGSVSVCRIVDGRGSYHVELQAPGFTPATLDLTVTGTDSGCNTCGSIDAQTVAVTMHPQSSVGADGSRVR